jgi:hypothetical protein
MFFMVILLYYAIAFKDKGKRTAKEPGDTSGSFGSSD